MIEKYELVNMIQKKKYYLDRLESLVYGSLDIRERDNKKYIYVHYRKDGKVVTKYVGEYSDSLYNQILSNNIEVKEINKRIKIIQKYIEDNNYYEQDLNDNIKDNIDRVRENIDVLLYDIVKLEDIREVQRLFSVIPTYPSFKEYGEIRHSLEGSGQRIDQFDLLIAATALHQQMTLVTSNLKHFERIQGLEIENWK